MSTLVSAFNFAPHSIRVSLDDRGEPWFLANDVCAILGYSNPRDAIAKHCKEGGVAKRDTLTSSGEQEMTYINEPNLYRLIIKSRKPEAEKFEAFVMEEVLPTIRKTGKYEHASMAEPTISHTQYFQLSEMINKAMRGWCFDNGDREKVINNIRLTFNLKSLKDLPASQFNLAMALAEKTASMANECLVAMNDFKEAMMREVVMGGAPHTSSITRKYKAKFGSMPKQINWVEMQKAISQDSN